MIAQRDALPAEIFLRPLSAAEWRAVANAAMQQPTFTDTARCLLLAPLALALTGWTADAPLPDDDGLRCLALAQWPLAELLAARERLVALSLATALEGDS